MGKTLEYACHQFATTPPPRLLLAPLSFFFDLHFVGMSSLDATHLYMQWLENFVTATVRR